MPGRHLLFCSQLIYSIRVRELAAIFSGHRALDLGLFRSASYKFSPDNSDLKFNDEAKLGISLELIQIREDYFEKRSTSPSLSPNLSFSSSFPKGSI
jgi:hypothetical protein